jgi:hypothetical protein
MADKYCKRVVLSITKLYSWETLHAEMLACQQCELSQSRQQVLIGSGNQQADYLWITEAHKYCKRVVLSITKLYSTG